MVEGVVYAGRELEAMAFARNYHKWILEVFAPYLGRRVVEVGAGTGSFSELLLERREPDSLTLVEPSEAMHRLLVERLARLPTGARVKTYNHLFADVAERLRAEARPDSIIYVNVLEHIADDEAELRAVHRTLIDGGRAFLFVPALGCLYGSFDEQLGHHRRYARRALREKAERAGFRILKCVYFDSAGVLPWWLKYRVLRSRKMEPGAVKFYDARVVPALKWVESRLPPPVGKNILMIAEKSSKQ